MARGLLLPLVPIARLRLVRPGHQRLQLKAFPRARLGVGHTLLVVELGHDAMHRAVHVHQHRLAILHLDKLGALSHRLPFAIVEIAGAVGRIELFGVDVHVVAKARRRAPGHVRVVAKQNAGIGERGVAHHVVARAVQADAVGVGGVPPAELRPVQEDRARVLGVLAAHDPHIAGGGKTGDAGLAALRELRQQAGGRVGGRVLQHAARLRIACHALQHGRRAVVARQGVGQLGWRTLGGLVDRGLINPLFFRHGGRCAAIGDPA
ncbi:hypothetical protein D3C73_1141070 [compost metagenome]